MRRCSGSRAHAGGADQVRSGFALEAVFSADDRLSKSVFRYLRARARAGKRLREEAVQAGYGQADSPVTIRAAMLRIGPAFQIHTSRTGA